MSTSAGSSAASITRPVLFKARSAKRVRPDIVFAREIDGGAQIIWRKYLPREDRIIYTTAFSRFTFTVPDDFGFLPAPDGRHLVVWEVCHNPRTAEPVKTYWRTVRVADSAIEELLESPGEPSHLPCWQTKDQVALIRVQGSSLQEMLQQYCRERFNARYDLARDFFPASGEEVARHEPVEYAMLRSLGIPSLGVLRPWWPRILPHLALSPDMRCVACTTTWDHLPLGLRYASNDGKVLPGTGARLDILDIDTGKRVWDKRIPYRLRKHIPSWELTTPPTFPWTSPMIGDLRWSQDSRYLAFSVYDQPAPCISILDTAARSGNGSSEVIRKEVIQVQDALNAYILPMLEN